jgi:hypothetical protein
MARNPSSIINFEGLSADRAEWKKFARVLFFGLLVPWIFLAALAEWVAYRVGADTQPEAAARLQTDHPNMIWYSYRSSLFGRFKLERVAIDRPDILVVGQSRPQSFRSAMFRPYTFYNLGSISYTMASFTDLLHHLPDGYNPKVIIMACDYYLFDPVSTKANIDQHMLQDFTPTGIDYLATLRDVLVMLPEHPDLLLAGLPRSNGTLEMGLGAYMMHMGFRKDGSTQWYRESGPDNPKMAEMNPWRGYKTIQGDSLGKDETVQFEQFVSEAHARGITVICVQLPMYTPAVEMMEHDKGANFGILRDYQARIANGYFDRLGVLAFDYLSFPGYSDNYHYFLDAVHPKEGLLLAVLNDMASDPRFLKILPKLDVAAIQQKVKEERNGSHYNVYGE